MRLPRYSYHPNLAAATVPIKWNSLGRIFWGQLQIAERNSPRLSPEMGEAERTPVSAENEVCKGRGCCEGATLNIYSFCFSKESLALFPNPRRLNTNCILNKQGLDSHSQWGRGPPPLQEHPELLQSYDERSRAIPATTEKFQSSRRMNASHHGKLENKH